MNREDAASVYGLLVMAVNLNNAPRYNGCKGVVVNYSNDRFRVRLEDGTFLKLKASNVVICSETQSPFTREEALGVLRRIGKYKDMTDSFGTRIRSLLEIAQFAVQCMNVPDTVFYVHKTKKNELAFNMLGSTFHITTDQVQPTHLYHWYVFRGDDFLRGTHENIFVFKRLVSSMVGNDVPTECTICFEEFGLCDAHILKCGHFFCYPCLQKYTHSTYPFIKCAYCGEFDDTRYMIGRDICRKY